MYLPRLFLRWVSNILVLIRLMLVALLWTIYKDCQQPADRVIFVASQTLSLKCSTPDIQVPDHASPVESLHTFGETVLMSVQQDQPACRPRNSSTSDDFDFKDEHSLTQESFITDFYEYEQGNRSILVKGRLKQNVKFRKDIGSSDFVIDVIGNGYKIPFFSLPPRSESSNNKSAIKERSFVSEAILDLLEKGLIVKCKFRPCIVNPLTVSVQNSGKKRLILDLRIPN